jgi:hypothetical protein
MLRAVWYWTGDIDAAITAAKGMVANTMILKCGYQDPIYFTNLKRRADFIANARKVRDSGLLLAAELYDIPGAWSAEADCLRWAVDNGAQSIVLNMEGPYEAEPSGANVDRLLGRFNNYAPVWACTDFRGDNLALPFHKTLAKYVAGWMPMIYPKTFFPNTPFGDIQRAFDSAYWSWMRLKDGLPLPGRTAPVLPAIQAYDGMDWEEMVGQIVLAWRWTLVLSQAIHGTSIYASQDINIRAWWGTKDGWDVVENAIRQMPPTKDPHGAADAAAAAAKGAVLAYYGV